MVPTNKDAGSMGLSAIDILMDTNVCLLNIAYLT